MEQPQLNWIANFIWGIADDVLRDLYVRGKYRDVILPMTVLRRLDAVLEPTKQAVLDMKATLDSARIVHQDQPLRQAAGQAFYNTSRFTLRDLKARASQQQLKTDFEAIDMDSYRVEKQAAMQIRLPDTDAGIEPVRTNRTPASSMTALLKDDTELYKQFIDNESFGRWLTDTVFGLTYQQTDGTVLRGR